MFRPNKILVVSHGQGADRQFTNVPGFQVYTINAPRLKHHNLWGYTAVVISSWTSGDMLKTCSRKLVKFLNNGGILVCLGCQCYDSQWIPFCNWKEESPKSASWNLTSEDAKLIFRDCNSDLLRFHEFWSHGTLEPPVGSKVMACADNRPIVCLIDEGINGAVLVTTLDPDFHAVAGLRMIDRTNEHEKKQAARLLVHNIFNWCSWKFEQRHSYVSGLLRKIFGLATLSSFFFTLCIVVWPLSIFIAVEDYCSLTNNNKWIAVSIGATSLFGFAMYITELWRKYRHP